VQQGTEKRVVMLEVHQQSAAAAGQTALPISLRSSLLLSTTDVLLDVQPLRTQPWMAALTTRSVILYEKRVGQWEPLRSIPITLPVITRDPRGRIVPAADHPFDLFLPGANCAASGDRADAVTLNCIASDDPWPVETQRAIYNSARNYFTGVLLPGVGRPVAQFYSAAAIPTAKYTLWIFAGVDGRAVSFDGANERAIGGAARNWGSDIAAVHTNCGSGTQVLASESGSALSGDSIQAFEIAEREAVALSAPLKFAGGITALWTTGGDTATAIVHTVQGGYDAYSITPVCNR
jgi:hypothetical protein